MRQTIYPTKAHKAWVGLQARRESIGRSRVPIRIPFIHLVVIGKAD